LAGKDHRLMHLVMLDQSNDPSRGGWQRGDDAFSGAVEQLEGYFEASAKSSTSSLIWSEHASSAGSGKRC